MPITTAIGSSNLSKLTYIEEAAFGVTPASVAPALNSSTARALRFTGESLDLAISKDSSKEIRPDRLTADLIPTNISTTGGVNFELSYGEYDYLMEAVLGGTFNRFGIGAIGKSSVSFTAAIVTSATPLTVPGTITASAAPTGLDAFTGLAKGQWFRLTAPGDAADGQVLQVHPTIAPTTTVITLALATNPLGSGTRAAVANCLVASSRVSDGTTVRSYTIERAHSDINQFFSFKGQVPSKMDLSFDSASLVTGSFDFMGKTSVRSNATQMTGIAPLVSQTFDVMNTVTGVGQVLLDGVALANTFAKSVKLSIDGKMRSLPALGVAGAAAVLPGTMGITGTIEIYLADGTVYDRFVNNTAASLTFGVRDGTSRGLQVTLPRVKFSDAKVNSGGLDQDAILSIPFTALYDPNTAHAIFIDTFSV